MARRMWFRHAPWSHQNTANAAATSARMASGQARGILKSGGAGVIVLACKRVRSICRPRRSMTPKNRFLPLRSIPGSRGGWHRIREMNTPVSPGVVLLTVDSSLTAFRVAD